MAIGVTQLGDMPGLTPDLGLSGCAMVRLTKDGTLATVAVTLPPTSGIKTIRRCFGAVSHNIPAAGVAAATGFTVNFTATPASDFIDLLVQGDPR